LQVEFFVVDSNSGHVTPPNIQFSLSSIVIDGIFVEVASWNEFDHSVFPECLLDVYVQDLRN
jgi:hypothetical protein